MKEKYVIVGNGIAAISAIDAIREVDQESEIIMFGSENHRPYNRISLSKNLLGTLTEEKLMLRKAEWYDKTQTKMFTDERVTSIQSGLNHIETDGGKVVEYTKLLIATGSKSIQPSITGIHSPHVMTLKTFEDAQNILSDTEHMKQVAHIGGGIQGLEMAWILSQLGKEVTLIELMGRLMPKQLDESSSKMLLSIIEK
ncbi:MAG: FAD-dependent oxidoreductase [Vallitaleaceae bacterium]|nr:FAD-dependent oxidoreductase [Vallitaleaceae bacterium]